MPDWRRITIRRQSGGGPLQLPRSSGTRWSPSRQGSGSSRENGVWGVPRRVREGRRACACGVITQGAQLPGTGVRGGSPGEKGQVEPLTDRLLFRPDVSPRCYGSCECLCAVADCCRSLVLLSPLLSAQPKSPGDKPTRTADSTRDRGREAARQHELLLGLGQYRVDAGLIFCQAGTPGRVGLPLALSLRLALGLLSPPGQQSLIFGVRVPRRLPDSPG